MRVQIQNLQKHREYIVDLLIQQIELTEILNTIHNCGYKQKLRVEIDIITYTVDAFKDRVQRSSECN